MRRASGSRTAFAGALAVLVALVCSGGACELVVRDDGAFLCDPGPGNCPPGQVCDPNRHTCIMLCSATSCAAGFACDEGSGLCLVADSGATDVPDTSMMAAEAGDGTVLEAAQIDVANERAMPQETGPGDSQSGCTAIGCPCSGDSNCASGVCGDQLTVTSSLYAAAGNANFCTKPCCTSSDCDEGTVCFGTAAGGDYCVLPAWLARSTSLGSGIGGQTCSENAACRSGLCAGNQCADTCCSTPSSATDCAAGTLCGFGTFPGNGFDTNDVAFCATSTSQGKSGSVCMQNQDCRGDLCEDDGTVFSKDCHDACRNETDCPADEVCTYVEPSTSSTDLLAACWPPDGSATEGAPCSTPDDCETGICVSHACTSPCFADSDCPSGQHCRPSVQPIQTGGSYSVLLCGK